MFSNIVAFSQYLNINANVSLRSAGDDVDMQRPGFALFIYLSIKRFF